MIKTKLPYINKKKATHIPVHLVREGSYKAWLKTQPVEIQNQVKQSGFGPGGARCFVSYNAKSKVKAVYAGVRDDILIYDICGTVEILKAQFDSKFLRTCSFELKGTGDLTNAYIGWGLSCYQFDAYKKSRVNPALLWGKKADKKRVTATVSSILMLKNLINIPANDLTPQTLEDAARTLAEKSGAKISVIKGKKLEDGFPLIHMVGKAAVDGPRLIDMRWGEISDPKLTIIGKGVTFDTGGLNLKPTKYMALMKKDMGGAAHALALGKMVMDLNLPVCLRVLIPAIENSVAAGAFRPGDIVKSRKGLTVENINTDAEGRLILADTLSYACEDEPNLLIDFATLTGSARAALGPDIPAGFATRKETGDRLQEIAMAGEDPVWMMPLWAKYMKHVQSPNADLLNSSALPGDLIYSALFLQQFLKGSPDWLHLDCYAWEHTGRPGRPRGGADTGLLSTLALIEERYVESG